ncbi:MAG: hypothetical protein RugAbin2_00063 [Rugosibacter sp.]|nr:hypothetical protein [Rugosibacter sp.]
MNDSFNCLQVMPSLECRQNLPAIRRMNPATIDNNITICASDAQGHEHLISSLPLVNSVIQPNHLFTDPVPAGLSGIIKHLCSINKFRA